MTHDPLCQAYVWETNPSPNIHYHGGCDCDLIALVRQDESSHPKRPDLRIIYGYELGYSDAVAKCIATVEHAPIAIREPNVFLLNWSETIDALRALQEKP